MEEVCDLMIDLSLNCQALLNLLKEKNIITDEEFRQEGIKVKREFEKQKDLIMLNKMKEDLT